MFAIFVALLVKSTLILVVAWLAAKVLARRSAATRFLVWMAAAIAIATLPLASVSISLPAVRVPDAIPASVLFHADAVVKPVPAAGAGVHASEKPLPPTRGEFDWRLAAMLLWAAGSLAGLGRLGISAIALWRTRRMARPIQSQVCDDLARECGIRRRTEVFELDCKGAVPMTSGILRPAIFLPPEARAWTDERVRIVLLHELAHIRRMDVAALLFARAVFRLCWWNPLAWIAARAIVRESELAADDAVLNAGTRASDYAGHLVDIARAVSNARFPLVAAAMARHSQIENRMTAILNARVNRKSPGRAAVALSALLTLGAAIPFAALRAQDAPAQTTSTEAVQEQARALMLAALSQKNHEMLEAAAKAAEEKAQYDTAQTLLEAAADARASASGIQSVEYGIGLLKIGDLDYRRAQNDSAKDFYTRAVALVGDRPEAGHAFVALGVMAFSAKNPAEAEADFERARIVDPDHAGIAWMWQALAISSLKKPDEAEAAFWNAINFVRPDTQEGKIVLMVFSNFLKQRGQTEEAEKVLSRIPASGPLPVAELPADVYKVGGGVKPPSVKSKVDPQYSEEARIAKLSGTILLRVIVGADGAPQNTTVLRGLGLGLDEKAVEAVNQWRFDPALKDGQPVKVLATIEVNFRLL